MDLYLSNTCDLIDFNFVKLCRYEITSCDFSTFIAIARLVLREYNVSEKSWQITIETIHRHLPMGMLSLINKSGALWNGESRHLPSRGTTVVPIVGRSNFGIVHCHYSLPTVLWISMAGGCVNNMRYLYLSYRDPLKRPPLPALAFHAVNHWLFDLLFTPEKRHVKQAANSKIRNEDKDISREFIRKHILEENATVNLIVPQRPAFDAKRLCSHVTA